MFETPNPSSTRAEISRANGAKSNGPITPEGKARCSQNATRHGLNSGRVVIQGESLDSYRALHRSFVKQFEPRTGVERRLVSLMAVSQWRLQRILAIETQLFGNRLADSQDLMERYLQRYIPNPDSDQKLAWAFTNMSGGSSLPLLTRYEGSIQRAFDRAFRQFHALRGKSKTPAPPQAQLGSQTVVTPISLEDCGFG